MPEPGSVEGRRSLGEDGPRFGEGVQGAHDSKPTVPLLDT